MAILSFWATTVLAQNTTAKSFEDTTNCVAVYVKNEKSQPNFTIACDGDQVVSQTVQTEDELQDPGQFKAELYLQFQSLVNSDHLKKCNQYDLDGVWWASCLR